MIAPRILKIDLQIIDIEVGTRHLEIDILLLHRGIKIISTLIVTGGNFDLNYLSYI